VPQGIRQIGRIEEILETPQSDLPDLMRDECCDLLEQIAEQTVRINARTEKIKALAAEAGHDRRNMATSRCRSRAFLWGVRLVKAPDRAIA
jgi:transposase